MLEELLPLEYKVKSYLASFQKICYTSKKIVFINVRKEFVLPTVYEIGSGSVTPQQWVFKIILHDRRHCKSDCSFVFGEIMLSGLPFIEEITQEKNLEIALRHADFLVVQPLQAFPINEVEKNIRNEFPFLKALSLAVKKCARDSIKIIVISPYVGIFEYLIMQISNTPGEQITGISRYSEARAKHHIANKLRVKLGAINNIILLGDNIIDCGSATVSRNVKPGREISLWEVLQLPKPLLGFLSYNEQRECKSIIPAEATANDRVFKAVDYSLETIIQDSKFLKYLTEPEEKEIMKRILYKEARKQREEEMQQAKEEKERGEEFEEGEEYEDYMGTYKEYLGDIEGGYFNAFRKDLKSEGPFGEYTVETKNLTSEATDRITTETDMDETALEETFKGEQDIDEYKDYFYEYGTAAGEEFRLLFKHIIEEEELAIREEPPDKRPFISDSFEELMAKLREKPMEEEEEESLGTYRGLKQAIMKVIEDEAWCKYTLLKKNDITQDVKYGLEELGVAVLGGYCAQMLDKSMNKCLCMSAHNHDELLVENDEPPYGYALASSFLGHLKRLIQGSEKISSMIAISDGSYQIPEGMFSAFPVKICGFSKRIEIEQDIDIFTVTMNRIGQFIQKQRRIYCFIDHIIEEEGLPEVERLTDSSTEEDISDAEGEDLLLPNLLQKKKLEKIKGNIIL